jgi:hypothetical protein
MDTTTAPTARHRSGQSRRRLPAVPALPAATVTAAFGPSLLVLWLTRVAADGVWLHPSMLTTVALTAVLALFAPHPASVMSLWTQSARDAALRGRPLWLRTVGLLPALLASRTTRLVTVAQLAGLAAGLALATGVLSVAQLAALA